MIKTELSDKVILTITLFGFVSFSLIMVTPLCGFLFQCGCDWPWQEFYFGCNHDQPDAIHKCPWCASMFAGSASIGLAMLAGIRFSLHDWSLSFKSQIGQIGSRVMIGLLSFTVISIVSAVFSAFWQDYPLGVGQVFNSF